MAIDRVTKILLAARRAAERELAGIEKALQILGHSRGRRGNLLVMPKRRRLSVSARKRIGAAQRARWAAWHKQQKKSA